MKKNGGRYLHTIKVWDDYSIPSRSSTRREEDYSSRRRRREEDDYSSRRRRTDEDDYSSRRRHYSSRRRRRDEDDYSSRRRRREEDDYSSRRRRRDEDDYSSRRRRRREEELSNSRDISFDIDYGRSSNKRRREESNSSRRDISHGVQPSNRKRGDNFHSSRFSSNERRRADSNTCRDDSPNSCSDRSVITEKDVSCKYCEDGSVIKAETPVGSFPGFVDDGLVTNILTRLPVESLLRFKSVCKHWLSLITHDHHLIHLHSTRSKSRPKLLCIAPLKPQIEDDGKTLPQRILSANLSFKTTGKVQQVGIHNIKKTTDDNWFHYDTVLGPVNGLFCFVRCFHGTTAAAMIYNVSTRQATPWIESTLLAEEKDKFDSEDNPRAIQSNHWPVYQMGFDPERKEHKLFCFWRLSANAKDGLSYIGSYSDSASSYASWEALTVGRDTKWRRINVVPDENNLIKINEVLPPYFPSSSPRSPVHANGTIYWRNKRMSSQYDLVYPEDVFPDYAPTEPDVIIAFDVGSEKFRVISIPSFILDEPRESNLNRPIAMLVLGGRITLIYQISDCTIKLWMLDDGVEKKLENCQGKGSRNWSAESITLPFCFYTRFMSFHGVPTRDDIILISVYREIGGSEDPKVVWLNLYDRKTKTCRLDEMDGTFSVPLHPYRSLFTTFTESLIPVQPASTRELEVDF